MDSLADFGAKNGPYYKLRIRRITKVDRFTTGIDWVSSELGQTRVLRSTVIS